MARNLQVHMGLLHYYTFGLEAEDDAQNVRVDTAHEKDSDQHNLSKISLSLSLSLSVSTAIYQVNLGKPVFTEAKDGGSGGDNWSYKSGKAPVTSSPPTNQHPVFTGWMPFLSPNQQCQNIEGKIKNDNVISQCI